MCVLGEAGLMNVLVPPSGGNLRVGPSCDRDQLHVDGYSFKFKRKALEQTVCCICFE